MKRTLILLTKKYPYENGEEFIETEMISLSEFFDRICIVSSAVKKGAHQTRKLPDNVENIVINDIQKPFLRYMLYSLKGLVGIRDANLRKELSNNKGLKKKIGILYTQGRVNRLLKKLLVHDRIKNLFEDKESDVIVYSYWFADLALLGCLLKNSKIAQGIKAISRAHGYDLYAERNPSNHVPFRDYVMRTIDAVFVCSKHGSQYLLSDYPEHAHKIHTSYLGTGDHGLSKGKQTNEFVMVTCSSIIPLKRLELLAKALHELENRIQHQKVRWVCIGDGPLLEDLKKYVQNELKSIKVDFMGRLRNEEVIEFYNNNYVDLFINVSETEGLPVSIMEAQSFGIPAIATDVGGTKEIVVNGLTGFLLPKNVTPSAIASSIEKIIHTPLPRESIHAQWEEHFHEEKNYASFIRHISHLVEKSQENYF